MKNTGIIGFKHLRVRCLIGVEPHELLQERELVIDLKVETDFSRCATTDSLHDTVDYVQLASLCTEIAKSKTHHLMETLAEDIVNAMLKHPAIPWAWVRIRKPEALPDVEFVLVEFERRKS